MKKHKDRCEERDFPSTKISIDTNIKWKNHNQKVPSYFKINADFKCINEKDNSTIGEKSTNIFKQNPVCSEYYIVSDLPEVLRNEFKSNFGINNVY